MKFISKLLLLVMVVPALIFFSPSTAANAASGKNAQGDIIRLSGDVTVDAGDTVNGDVVVINGDIIIKGTVQGDVVAVFGDIIVDGQILGDTVAATGRITVGNNGRIHGDTVEALGGNFGGTHTGINIDFRPTIRGFGFPGTSNVASSLIGTLALFLILSLIYVIMPKKSEEMVDDIEHNFGKRLGIGILSLIASPIALVILMAVLAITIVGLFLVPLAFFIAGLVALVPAYIFIGRKTVELIAKQKASTYAALAAGVLTVWLVKTVLSFGGFFTGWINTLLSIAILAVGVGTLLNHIFSDRRRRKANNQNINQNNNQYNNQYGNPYNNQYSNQYGNPYNNQYNQYNQYPPYAPQGGGYGYAPQPPAPGFNESGNAQPPAPGFNEPANAQPPAGDNGENATNNGDVPNDDTK